LHIGGHQRQQFSRRQRLTDCSVSVGCGLPATVQVHDQTLPKAVPWDSALWSHLRIEQYRQRVSLTLAPNAMVSRAHSLDHGRLATYRLLNLAYLDLEQEIIAVAPSCTGWPPYLRISFRCYADDGQLGLRYTCLQHAFTSIPSIYWTIRVLKGTQTASGLCTNQPMISLHRALRQTRKAKQLLSTTGHSSATRCLSVLLALYSEF